MEFSAQQIATLVGGEIAGDSQRMVSNISGIEQAKEGDLSFLCEEKYLSYLAHTSASVVLMSRSLPYEGDTSATIIRVDNARGAMAQLLRMVSEVMHPAKHGIEQPCYICEGVQVPEDAYIGAFAYIGRGVKLGRGVQIYPQVYIGDGVEIGEGTILYAGVKVYYDCQIGKQCIVHAGAVIGSDGFGFEPDEKGVYQKVPQLGRVIVEDDVEIGANTTIDRAMMGETRVGQNTKLDNLVQLGHNVQVGQSTVMCAQAGVAGSSKVGSHCTLTGQVGIAGHLEIVDGCIIGAQSGVANSIKKSGIYMGTPAIDASIWRRAIVRFKQSGQH